MAVQRERNDLVFRLCMYAKAIIPVHEISAGFPWPVFLMTSGETWPKGPGER